MYDPFSSDPQPEPPVVNLPPAPPTSPSVGTPAGQAVQPLPGQPPVTQPGPPPSQPPPGYHTPPGFQQPAPPGVPMVGPGVTIPPGAMAPPGVVIAHPEGATGGRKGAMIWLVVAIIGAIAVVPILAFLGFNYFTTFGIGVETSTVVETAKTEQVGFRESLPVDPDGVQGDDPESFLYAMDDFDLTDGGRLRLGEAETFTLKENEARRFTVSLTAGQPVIIEIKATERFSEADPVMWVTNEANLIVGAKDEKDDHDDNHWLFPVLPFTPSADGEYEIIVAEPFDIGERVELVVHE